MKNCKQCATTWENGDCCPVCGMRHDMLSAYSNPEMLQPQKTQKKPVSAGTIVIVILMSITALLLFLLYTGSKESQKRKQTAQSGMYKVGDTIVSGTYTLVRAIDQYSGIHKNLSSIDSIAPIIKEAKHLSPGSTIEITLQEANI